MFRTITNIDSYLDAKNAHKFVDLVENLCERDQMKRVKLQHYKELVEELLGIERVLEESVIYTDPDGVEEDVNKDSLRRLSDNVFALVRKDVDVAMEDILSEENEFDEELNTHVMHTIELAAKSGLKTQNSSNESVDSLSHENADFSDINEEDDFEALTEPDLAILRYLRTHTCQPLVLHGPAGSGLSTCAARAAHQVASWLPNALEVTRYLGLTVPSQTAHALLQHVYNQVQQAAGETVESRDWCGLLNWFFALFNDGPPSNIDSLVIILDSLDSFKGHDRLLDWLPAFLHSKVKVIVTLNTGSDIYDCIRLKITRDDYYYQIPSLDVTYLMRIVSSQLMTSQRRISFEQLKAVRAAVAESRSPLHASLIAQLASFWRSWENHAAPRTSEDTVISILRLLEDRHRQIPVRNALLYLRQARAGLADAEMQDLLSLEDEVLDELFAYSSPAVRRAPSYFWTLLSKDLCGLIRTFTARGTLLRTWKHALIEDTVKKHLSASEILLREIKSHLAHYFQGTHAKFALKSSSQTSIAEGGQIRYVPTNPDLYTAYAEKPKPNRRKLHELPHHLQHGDLIELCLCNYDWLKVKLTYSGFSSLLSDFDLAADPDVKLIKEVLKAAEMAVTLRPNLLGQELTGRLLPHFRYYANIRNLIGGCDLRSLTDCPMVASFQNYPTSGSPLVYTICNFYDPKTASDIGVFTDGRRSFIRCKNKKDETVFIWDVAESRYLPALRVGLCNHVYSSPSGQFFTVFHGNGLLHSVQVANNAVIAEIKVPAPDVRHVTHTERYVAFTYEQSNGPVVLDIQANMCVHRFNLRAKLVAISDDDERLFLTADNSGRFYALPMMETKSDIMGFTHMPQKVTFLQDHTHLAILLSNGAVEVSHKVTILHLRSSYSADIYRRISPDTHEEGSH